jgi:hypothetical protein
MNFGEDSLDKKVALFTMHELLVTLDMPIVARNMILAVDPRISKSAQDLVIKIKHDLDESSLRIIQPIVEKRNLRIEKIEDSFVIH